LTVSPSPPPPVPEFAPIFNNWEGGQWAKGIIGKQKKLYGASREKEQYFAGNRGGSMAVWKNKKKKQCGA